MNNSNHGLKAFLFGIIPGAGHLYLRKFGRGFLYPVAILLLGLVGLMIGIANGTGFPFFVGLLLGFGVWLISMLDLVITIFNQQKQTMPIQQEGVLAAEPASEPTAQGQQPATGTTIALAFIPGLGHMHMGLMYRGLTYLIGFFGIFVMVFFIAALANEDDFFVFLGALPIIWIINLFDAIQLYHRKNRGETLVDRTIFEDLLEHRESGKKSKMLAMLLSLMPGAGHMYLGLQRRGLQLMAAFLFSIYILDVLHLSIFLFLIPIIWFFSFFDALQQIGKVEQGKVEDVPLVGYLINHQRWVGIGLLALGLFYIIDSVTVPTLERALDDIRYRIWYERYFQTTLVSLLLVGGGIKLLLGSKKKKGGGEE